MAVTKTSLVDSVLRRVHLKPRKKRKRQLFLFPELDYTPLTRKRANELVEATLELMKQTIEKGEDLKIYGFGKFQVRFRWARKARDPQTGKPIVIPSNRTVVFKCSQTLRSKLNPSPKGDL
jgi:integration host factor subunit alpha